MRMAQLFAEIFVMRPLGVVSVKFCKKGIGGMWLDEIKRFMGRVKGGRSHLPFLGEWFELGGAGLRRGVFVLIAE